MKNLLSISALKLLTMAALAMAAPLSMAGGSDVSWSLSVGSPYPPPPVYAPPPPVVYVQPQPVYVQPRPVYVQPRPVYVQPVTVVRYGQPYYVEEIRHGRMHHHHGGHRDHRRYD